MRVKFDHQKQAAESIYTFYFRPEAPVRYIAGQFIELFIPHSAPDNRGIKRWFTLSSSPTEDLLAITTKLSAAKPSTFKAELEVLEPGTLLRMHPPMGDFVLPKDPNIPLLFVAGGIGCTPFRSILKYLQDSKQQRDITMIYVVSNKDELAFLEIFKVLGENFVPVVGRPLTAGQILGFSSADHYIYLSGPEPMVELLNKSLKEADVHPAKLRTDFFPNYPAI